jgi:hypothetical protein
LQLLGDGPAFVSRFRAATGIPRIIRGPTSRARWVSEDERQTDDHWLPWQPDPWPAQADIAGDTEARLRCVRWAFGYRAPERRCSAQFDGTRTVMREGYRGQLPDSCLKSLSADAREARWAQSLRDGASVLLAEHGGKAHGFVSYGPSRDDDTPETGAEIYGLYVHPHVGAPVKVSS